MFECLSYDFMQHAVVSGILASIVCGVIGPFIVIKRLVFISGGLSHAAFGGLGMAYYFGINPLYGATVFALMSAVGVVFFEQKKGSNDLIIGIMWAVGMAIGIVFIHMTPGYAPDLMSFLFGNILAVSRSDIIINLLLVFVITCSIFFFFKGFTFITLDEEYAKARKLPVRSLNVSLLILVALSIVTLIQVVGVILVIALLTIPVAIAMELSQNFNKIIVISILCGIAICLIGLYISYFIEFPSGSSIVLFGGLVLALVKIIKKVPFKRDWILP